VEHLRDHLVALGNLGLSLGRKVAEGIPYPPRGLLLG